MEETVVVDGMSKEGFAEQMSQPKIEPGSIQEFILKHKDRCLEWTKHHPREHFPIIQVQGEWHWLTRAERRAMK